MRGDVPVGACGIREAVEGALLGRSRSRSEPGMVGTSSAQLPVKARSRSMVEGGAEELGVLEWYRSAVQSQDS